MSDKTKAIMVRLPSELVTEIDRYCDVLYTSRPDFVAAAIREFVLSYVAGADAIVDDLNALKISQSERNILYAERIREMVFSEGSKYMGMEGSPVAITVRLPIGLFDLIKGSLKVLPLFKSQQAFYRTAVQKHLSSLELFSENSKTISDFIDRS